MPNQVLFLWVSLIVGKKKGFPVFLFFFFFLWVFFFLFSFVMFFHCKGGGDDGAFWGIIRKVRTGRGEILFSIFLSFFKKAKEKGV